jgi:hypothetical protein
MSPDGRYIAFSSLHGESINIWKMDSDFTGFDFWLTKLNQFNGSFINAEMVKAFITSAEYRNRFGPSQKSMIVFEDQPGDLQFFKSQATPDWSRCVEAGVIVFHQKDLDTIAIDTLYKTVRANIVSRTARKKLSMMTSRTNKQPVDKWQPCAAMYAVVCALGLSSTSVSLRTNIFGGRLGQEASIDSRHIKQ